MKALHTDPDCNLDGIPVDRATLGFLTSEQIAAIVGLQSPGLELESAEDFDWSYQTVDLKDLVFSNDYGEEPEGGWKAAYSRHVEIDRELLADGNPEVAGRPKWLRKWAKDTSLYPLYLAVEEDGSYRILDGYHRLAGAFWHDLETVQAFVGVPKPVYDLTTGRR